jgi:hypothetical protein
MTIETARAATEAIVLGNPVRAILLRILHLLETEKHLSAKAGGEILAYGNALRTEGRWPLAADVFKTINTLFTGLHHSKLLIDAAMGLGASARNAGDWATSDRGYAQARHLSDVIGDRARSLKSRVGAANSMWIRGNLPDAERELDEVILEARQRGIQEIEAIALQDQSAVSHHRGNFQRAVHLAYRSLELNTDRSARDRIIESIAAAYAELGMRKVARDAHLIVAATSAHQSVRSHAQINLMDLAIREGDEGLFDEYQRELASSPLESRLMTFFMYYQAQGFRRFGRPGASEMFAQAKDYASRNQLNQLAFEIEAELEKESTSVGMTKGTVFQDDPSDELGRIAEALQHLREEAISG